MVANSSAPIQSRQFIFSEPFAQSLPFYSTEKNKNKNKNKKGKTKKKKRINLWDLGENPMLGTKFCALVCRDTAWLRHANVGQFGCGFLRL